MPGPTLRSLAAKLGVSRTTISEALRGSPRVLPATAKRILAAAEAAGYQRNPLAGAVMSELRRSRGGLYRGLLAIIGVEEPDRPHYAVKFHDELVRGAKERANELGFKVERFTAGEHSMRQQRLDQILHARGIAGVLLLPTWRDPDFLKIDWSHYAGVYLDYHIERPALRCICCDHFRSMFTALQRLHELGYRRPGVVLPRQHDERLQHRWMGAFQASPHTQHHPDAVPTLFAERIESDGFTAWFRHHQPDVVLSHVVEIIDWMKAGGARVPQTHGFFCLNLVHADRACAGLDLQPALIGGQGAEIVIAQLHRNERGIPATYSLTTLPAKWVDGPTLRPQRPRTAKAAR
jgi:LacI family transcriptional regulator